MRNFDFKFVIRSAVVAITCVVAVDSRDALAQARRGSFFSPPRTASAKPLNGPNQIQNPASTVTPAPGPASAITTPIQANIQFDELLDRAIQITSKRYLNATPTGNKPGEDDSHSPWQIFHCILAMRQECVLRMGKEKVNAIEWISTTEPHFRKEPWMLLTPHGAKFHPYSQKFWFEGHPGQFLALLSQCDLPMDHEFRVQGKVVKLSDVINNSMKEVNTKEEVTWVLWALQHYLKPDAEWFNQSNEKWSIERLVQMETAAPVVGAPCGGNHRLFALTRARDKYLQNGGRLRGVWLQADQKIKQHIEIARSLQNGDGSFSADSYKGPMHSNDVNLRFNTSGHTMEFLSIGLPQARLNEPWVRNAVWMLSRELIIHQKTEIDCGPLFHTLNALTLYRDRIRPKPTTSPDTSTPDGLVADSSGASSPKSSAIEKDATIRLPEGVKLTEKPNNSGLIAAPDAKTGGIGLDASKSPKAGMTPSDPQPVKSGTAAGKDNVAKLDPSRLADIGKPAPGTDAGTRKALPQQNQSPTGAPGLLPEQTATPLGDSASPNGEEASLIEGNSAPLAPATEHHESVHEIAQPIVIDLDEPASALSPVNQ